MTAISKVQINSVEEIYVAIQGYSSIIFPIRNLPQFTEVFEEYYDLESELIQSYDDFMEDPSLENLSLFDKNEFKLRVFVDDILNPKLESKC
jgi:hypothetical protein